MDRADYLGKPIVDGLTITAAAMADAPDWLTMRAALWPHGPAEEHVGEIAAALGENGGLNLIARAGGAPIGFAEASMRHDYVNGCDSSPVAFIEGIYVAPAYRRHGVAAELVRRIEAWASLQGCTELASDARLGNVQSHAMHHALGFEETQRVVYFRKVLG